MAGSSQCALYRKSLEMIDLKGFGIIGLDMRRTKNAIKQAIFANNNMRYYEIKDFIAIIEYQLLRVK